MIGTSTNVVTAVEVTNWRSADSPHLPDLLNRTKKRFAVKTVAADKGYINHSNLDAIVGAGRFRLSRSKRTTTPGAYRTQAEQYAGVSG